METWITRKKRGKSYQYYNNGKIVKSDRFKSLGIPPAWTSVKIAVNAGAKIQVIGLDISGKKQYIYHKDHVKTQDIKKWKRCVEFVKIVNKVSKKFSKSKDPCAIAFLALLETHMRVGTEMMTKGKNPTFGLTTLRRRHLKKRGKHLYFEFLGKRSKFHSIRVPKGKVLNYVRGRIKYDKIFPVDANELNKFIGQYGEFTAKDLRTYSANKIFVLKMQETDNVQKSIEATAEALGNTKKIARDSYISPKLRDAGVRGKLRRGNVDKLLKVYL